MTPGESKTQRRLSIRTKLLVALAVPVLVVAVITGFQANHAGGQLDRTKQDVTIALLAGGPSAYVTALMNERNISALELIGLAGAIDLGDTKSVPQARSVTDKTQDGFLDQLDRAGSDAEELYEQTFEQASKKLGDVRRAVDSFPDSGRSMGNQDAATRANDVYQDYTKLISSFHDASADAVATIDDALLRASADAVSQISLASDMSSRLSRNIALPLIGGTASTGEQEQWRVDALEDLRSFEMARGRAVQDLAATPAQQKVVAAFNGHPAKQKFIDEVEYFGLHGEVRGGNAAIPTVIGYASDQTRPNTNDATAAATTSLNARGDHLIAAAKTSRNLYLLVFVLATLTSIALALVIARSIARPLLSIASQADDMATRRLPAAVGSVLATPIGQDVVEPELDPITVESRDEVADVAASINVVQQRALELAVEQAVQRRNFADTFLNLGRRVQGLVARQLDFITELEETETDPETLADLFKLDHLATRIRRNAESLVVLAGVTRRQRRGEPAPVIDALRSALGEVDDYPRVDIGDVEDALLPVSVAADLAHILAELIENGLNFSPPDTTVDIEGHHTEGGYRITVVDRGIGMTDDQVATANRRLSGNESFTVAPSRYMGHYVAGHLATGLGIQVALVSTSGDPGRSGTIATVDVPEGLLAHPAAEAERVPVVDPPSEATSFQPAAPPAAPAPETQTDSLSALLSTHRRLSRPGASTDPGDTGQPST